MTQTRQRPARYDRVAISLHWLIAFMILGLLAAGFIMTGLDHADPLKYQLYQLHKSFGITVLALSLVRLAWRLAHPKPAMPETMKAWESFAAHAAHWAFYGLMIGMPMAGWLGVSASPLGIPTRIFNLFTLPHLPVYSGSVADIPPGDSSAHTVSESLFEIHAALAWCIIVLLALHIGAALKHHFVVKDDVLLRMTPQFLHRMLKTMRGQNA